METGRHGDRETERQGDRGDRERGGGYYKLKIMGKRKEKYC